MLLALACLLTSFAGCRSTPPLPTEKNCPSYEADEKAAMDAIAEDLAMRWPRKMATWCWPAKADKVRGAEPGNE